MSAVASPAVDSRRPMTDAQLDQLAINCIRTLSIDAVQQAKSGHPGTPMALAPLIYTLWNRVMRFDPQDPIWPNRDRFVLSNGHASMLLWSVLHLTGTRAVNAEYERLGNPRSRSTTFVTSANSARLRVTPSIIWFQGSRPPPDRWDRGSPTAWAWPLPSRGSPTATIAAGSRSSGTTSMRFAGMAA